MELQLQKTREYKQGKCSFEELMVVSNITTIGYLDSITEAVFECIEKLKDLEQKLNDIDSSN